MREVARRLQDAADPSAGDEARWDSELPAVSRVAPRTDAARIWLLLAAHGEHDDELLDEIRRAARDESPEVRRRVDEDEGPRHRRALAALLSRQRDVIVADADSPARLLEALASFVRAGSGSARRTLLGLDDLLR